MGEYSGKMQLFKIATLAAKTLIDSLNAMDKVMSK